MKIIIGTMTALVTALCVVFSAQLASSATAAPPPQPRSLTASIGETAATVHWAPGVTTSYYSGATTGYQIRVSETGRQFTAGASDTSITFARDAAGIMPAKTYTFFLWAMNGSTLGPASAVSGVLAPGQALQPPGAPTSVKLSASTTVMNASWAPPAAGSSQAAVTSYVLTLTGPKGAVTSSFPASWTSGNVTSPDGSGYWPAGSYTVTVRANSRYGYGPDSAVATATISGNLLGVGIYGGTGADWQSGTWMTASIPRGGSHTWQGSARNVGTVPARISLIASGSAWYQTALPSALTVSVNPVSATLQPGESISFSVTVSVAANAPLGPVAGNSTNPSLAIPGVMALVQPISTSGGNVTSNASAAYRLYVTVI